MIYHLYTNNPSLSTQKILYFMRIRLQLTGWYRRQRHCRVSAKDRHLETVCCIPELVECPSKTAWGIL